MEAKDFAVGFRVQHPQVDIDLNQYGSHDYDLPAAAYKFNDIIAQKKDPKQLKSSWAEQKKGVAPR